MIELADSVQLCRRLEANDTIDQSGDLRRPERHRIEKDPGTAASFIGGKSRGKYLSRRSDNTDIIGQL